MLGGLAHGADHVRGDLCMPPDVLSLRPSEVQLHSAGFRARTMVTRSECAELPLSVMVIDQGHKVPTRMSIFSSMREAARNPKHDVEYERAGAGKLISQLVPA